MAYLECPDFSLPDDHPRLTWGHYAVGAVPYYLMPATSLLRRLYRWEPLRTLVEAVLDRGPVYPYADPFGSLNLAVMQEGDELQWRLDQTDFVVSLAIQTADHGGHFEVFPRIRSAYGERYDDVAAARCTGSVRWVAAWPAMSACWPTTRRRGRWAVTSSARTATAAPSPSPPLPSSGRRRERRP
jgi:hypothetical protein